MLMTKTFARGQPVPWRFKPGTTATITWIELVSRRHRVCMVPVAVVYMLTSLQSGGARVKAFGC